MRTIAAILGITLVLALGAHAAGAATNGAGMRGSVAIGVLGGLTVPTGQLARKADMNATLGESGLDLKSGGNWGGSVDYYVTDRLSVGAFYGDGTLHMNDFSSQGVTVKDLLHGRTRLLGGTAKFFFPGDRPWTPYSYVAVAQFHRVGQISRDILRYYPETTVFELADDAVGYSGGVGGDYVVSRGVSLGLIAGYWYSGKLTHTFRYAGFQTIVQDWAFWNVDAGVTVRFPMKR